MSKKLLNLCLAMLLSVVSTAAWALSEVNGVYQIGTAADLEEFAQLVNGGGVYANAVLTADIDRGIDGTMIGTQTNEYQGLFDGAGHTIKINMYPEGDAALFWYTGYRAVIQNLKVTGTITTSSKFAAAIVARNKAVIRGCYADVTINSSVAGDATHGGIVAVGYGGTTVENCLAKVTILGETTQNCGGVVGWAEKRCNIANCLVVSDDCTLDVSNGLSSNIARNGGNLKVVDVETYNADPYANRPAGASYNNYVTNQWGDNVATTVVPYDELADGRICYQLNNDQSKINWVQRIGTDPFPVPAAFGTGQVYASAATDCDGKAVEDVTYSNDGSTQATAHQFDKYGICSVCGCFNFNMFDFDNPEKFDKKDMSVLLGTQEDFTKVEGWNRIANGFRLNMKLTNDVEFTTEPGQQIFNSSDWIDGNFNGQGHAITINFTEMSGYAGLFPEMAGNIENLILHGSLQTNGARVGSLCAEARMALVRNVYSDVDITSSVAGDNTSGGFFGWMGEVEKKVENCIYAGDFTLPEGAPYVRVGGFSGWAATKTYFNNCAVLGNIIGAGDQSAQSSTENSGNISRNWGSIVTENCYVVNPITGRDIADQDKYTPYDNQAGIASGELAFFLNGKQSGLERFYQVIGTDPEPMPFEKAGGLVYSAASSFRCDGTPLGSGGYTNDPSGEPVIPPHTFEDGWCSVCGHMDENFITPVDGWFEISDGAQLVWWSAYANSHKDASARLTEDIDMADYMDRFTPAQKFVGTFDGQGHTISNFVITGSGDYQGMISTISSGAVIKNFIFDSTCSISGNAFCGIIGGTDGSGDIYIEGVGNEGTVTTINQNAAGILGVDQGGSMNLHIKNCYVSGTIIGGRESGAICGYSNANSVVENCWSTITIPQSAIYDSDSFTRGSAQVVNCYEADIEGVDANKQQHVRPMAENRRCNPITLEEVANGALCYKVNGNQFREPAWYQTIEDDAHPYPFDNHAIVVFGADQYFSVLNDADLESVAASIHSYEQDAIGETVATQSLLDKLSETVEALIEVSSIDEFADALDSVSAAKAAVKENAAVYKAYIDKCEEIKAFLASNDTFAGALRDALEYYLSEENADEPSEDNPLGTYEYIIEKHTATAEEIAAETERVDQWLQKAIASDYAPGSDISKLIPNSDFSQQNEKWTGGFASSWGTSADDEGTTFYGVEAWNRTGDMYQTVEEMKPGYYLIGTHAAFRPSNNRYSLNYAAGIYANGIFNYFPAAIEDPVSVGEAEDGVNCNLTIKSAFDLPIYEDGFTTEGDDMIGYVPQGETGMAIAAKAGRYQVYTIAYVGEDGKLTIGIKNPGTKYSSDWSGWSALEVKYCGEDETQTNPALDDVLENMSARAQTIIDNDLNCEDIYYGGENVAKGPNFPAALRDALQAAVDQVDQVTTVEDKVALAKTFSDLFQQVYEGKQAYIELINYANTLDIIDTGNLPLVERDEFGDWFETGEMVFSEEETNAVFDATSAIVEGYLNGSYTTEEALNPKAMMDEAAAAIASLLPEQDEDGYYLIGNTKEFVVYRAIASEMDKYAKGKLTADIELEGIEMLPIGHNRGENAEHIFAGIFDGQGYALNNVYIDDKNIPSGEYAEPATLFYELQNATVKNFKLTGEMYTSHQFSGPITRWMSGKSTIDNVEIDVAFHLAPNLSGDTSSGGVIGRNGSANSLISNCLVKTHLIGEGDNPHWYVGGVAGWADAALVIKNTLILSEYTNVGVDGDNSRTISRGTKCTPTNVFVSQFFREAEGTLVTPEQLASGETTWNLNNKTGDNPYWFQTLGTEPTPHLFGGDAVYLYAGQYTNDKPNPQLNAFAYNLDAKLSGDKVIVSFDLNAEAESAEIRFSNGYTKAVEDELTAGSYSVTVPASELGEDPKAVNFEIAVTGKGSLDVIRMGESLKVWGPYGMAINNNPASKNFGQVLIAESYPEEIAEIYISHDKPGAIYAYTPDFQPVNAADGTPGFYGGLPIRGENPLSIVGTSYKFDLKDLRFTDDGRLFVARSAGLTPSSVYEINPEDLDEPWKPVFTGGELDEATGITYVGDDEQTRMALSLAFNGAGEDLKMYVLGGQRSAGGFFATDYNCSIYNLGTATEWTTAPSANFEPLDGVYTISPVDVGIYEDGQGGLWYIQRRSDASAEIPAIKHFDAEGNEDYSNTNSTTVGGRIAVTTNGNYLAIPTANGTIVLYETNYVPMENGKIFLNPKKTISVGESRVTALAFDYADNLYVASASTETFSRYTIPTENKVVVTPGNGIGLGVPGDVNCDGDVSIADGVAVLNAMAGQEVPGNADVNGDGEVSIADFVAVLNIMAGQ